MTVYDIIIAGAGPAGLTAALYARRAGKTVLLIEKESFGGQIVLSPLVENYPFTKPLSGTELVDSLVNAVLSLGAEICVDTVTGVTKNEDGSLLVKTEYDSFTARSLIIATGLKHRRLGLEGEASFIGKGISFCAVCDGAFFKGKTVAVIGDSTFIHSGITGLVNIAYNNSASTVIILDNSITGMTGHQQNPTTGYNIKGDPAAKIDLETLCRAVGIKRVRVVDPYNLKECETAVKEELAVDEASVIISRRPCVLLKYVKTAPALRVTDACRGCKSCMKLGCPSISMVGKKARIDATLCVGCEVCSQLCAFDAIQK